MNLVINNLKSTQRSLSIVLIALAIYLTLGPVPETLVLDLSIPLPAEPWRLLTAHLAHSDPRHLIWDCAGLLLVAWLYEPLLGQRLWVALIAGALIIDMAIFILTPEVLRYCGLSGLINSVVGAGLAVAWLERRDPLLLGFGLLITAKVVIENLTAAPLFSNTSWPPLHLAHLVGLVTGVAVGLLQQRCHAEAPATVSSRTAGTPNPPFLKGRGPG